MENFADRLIEAVERKGTPACVGLDPQFRLIPGEIRRRAVDSAATGAQAACVAAFCQEVIEIVAPLVGVVKPQVAFFEQLGTSGMLAYADAVRRARQHGLIVIGDVKRGDISSTAEAYAAGHLREAHGDGHFTVDAVTVNPYLGSDGVRPFIEAANETGRGVFVLVKTSNKSSADFQDLKLADGDELFVKVAAKVNEWGGAVTGKRGYSSVGAVVGATHPQQAVRLRALMPGVPFLVPGYGAQGAGAADVMPCFREDGLGAVVNSSRGVIYAWTRSPYKEQFGEERWRDAIEAAARDMISDLHQALQQARKLQAGPPRT
ncbi:MAG TPA: orotidine-5'-phosphate decarboxylase [Planctomycetota bacterium]|nr:orotidine-5'-phosphate decarboxylase [Planctomycetota bacterium]